MVGASPGPRIRPERGGGIRGFGVLGGEPGGVAGPHRNRSGCRHGPESTIRFSLGREKHREDIDYVLTLLPPVIERLRNERSARSA
jgi:hypothetical protein